MSSMVWPFLTRTFSGRLPGIGGGDATAADPATALARAAAESGRAAALGAGVALAAGAVVAGAGLDFDTAVESRFTAAGGESEACGATGGRGVPAAVGASAAAFRSFALASPVPRAAFAR